MRIKDFELNDETVIELGRFAVLWNLFEKVHCGQDCTPKELTKIAPTIEIDEEIMQTLAVVLNARRIWFQMMVSDYAIKSLHPDNARMSREEEIELMEDFLKWKSDNRVLGCLLIINRIRNNLLHGLKIAEQLDDQIELFKAVNMVLENIEKKRESA